MRTGICQASSSLMVILDMLQKQLNNWIFGWESNFGGFEHRSPFVLQTIYSNFGNAFTNSEIVNSWSVCQRIVLTWLFSKASMLITWEHSAVFLVTLHASVIFPMTEVVTIRKTKIINWKKYNFLLNHFD